MTSGVLTRAARRQLDALGAVDTKIVLSGDLDEYAIAALRADPVDVYGVGTSLVTGSGAPTAGMVYKLVAVDGRPVEKRSADKQSHGGRKSALRRHKASGTATEEVIFVVGGPVPDSEPGDRVLPVPLMRGGRPVDELPTLAESREHLRRSMVGLPWEGLTISAGEPAIPTTLVTASRSGRRRVTVMSDIDRTDRPGSRADRRRHAARLRPSQRVAVRAGAEDIIEPIAAAIADTRAAGGFVVYTQDWHPDETPHFADFGGLWPVHCVIDSAGADLLPGVPVRRTGGAQGFRAGGRLQRVLGAAPADRGEPGHRAVRHSGRERHHGDHRRRAGR